MNLRRAGVLVVDDECSVTDLLSTALEEEGYSCVTAASGEDALKRLPVIFVDVALLDLRLPGMSGMDVLKVIKSTYPRTAVIVITALGDVQTAVQAMKSGAVDYITKPFEVERVSHAIQTVLKDAAFCSSEPVSFKESIELSDEEVDWTRYLERIADGIETRLNSLTSHVMTLTVINNTVDIARSMDIPKEQIDRWVDARRKHIKRITLLDAVLEKV